MNSSLSRKATFLAAGALIAGAGLTTASAQDTATLGAEVQPLTLAAAQEGQPRQRRRPPPMTAPVAAPKVTVARVDALPAEIGPDDPLWAGAAALEVALQPQVVASPMLDDATVQNVQVEGLTDGTHIAWRFSWSDAHPATSSETGIFSDAVGIQFPLEPGAPHLMGAPGMPVHSMYWRAQWQTDIDEGFQDVRSKYPNAWSDVYWFASDRNFQVPGSFEDDRSHAWFVGLSAGNPMSTLHRATPVEEVTAEGVGTLTHVPGGIAEGRGRWSDGQWQVVISRRIIDDQLSSLFAPGNSSQFAVAIWDGEAGNVGGRKHHSLWIDFEVQP